MVVVSFLRIFYVNVVLVYIVFIKVWICYVLVYICVWYYWMECGGIIDCYGYDMVIDIYC